MEKEILVVQETIEEFIEWLNTGNFEGQLADEFDQRVSESSLGFSGCFLVRAFNGLYAVHVNFEKYYDDVMHTDGLNLDMEPHTQIFVKVD